MTCNDCIHYELCKDSGTLMYHSMTAGRLTEKAERKCPFKKFKNKADFVEMEWYKEDKFCSYGRPKRKEKEKC